MRARGIFVIYLTLVLGGLLYMILVGLTT